MKTNYLKNISNGVHFLTKLQDGCMQLYQKCIPQQVLFRLFVQICCYLSKFWDILGKFISQKRFGLVTNRCNVFKIFIPTKIIYTRFWSLAAIVNFLRMTFCGRASWTLNPRNIAMFSFRKRRKMENLSAQLQFLDGLFRQ